MKVQTCWWHLLVGGTPHLSCPFTHDSGPDQRWWRSLWMGLQSTRSPSLEWLPPFLPHTHLTTPRSRSNDMEPPSPHSPGTSAPSGDASSPTLPHTVSGVSRPLPLHSDSPRESNIA